MATLPPRPAEYDDDFVLVDAKGQTQRFEPVLMFRLDNGDHEQLIMARMHKRVMLVVQVDGTGDEPLFWLGPMRIPPHARPLGGPDVATGDLHFVQALVDAPLCEQEGMAFPMRLFDKNSLHCKSVLGDRYQVLAPVGTAMRKRKADDDDEQPPNKRQRTESLPVESPEPLTDLFVGELARTGNPATTGQLLKASPVLWAATPGATFKEKRHELNRSGGVVVQLEAAGRIRDSTDGERCWTVVV
jgi:hypothetical protein